MSYGLECWNRHGVRTLSAVDRLTRYIGSYAVAGIFRNRWTFVPVNGMASDGTWVVIPTVDWISSRIVSGGFEVRGMQYRTSGADNPTTVPIHVLVFRY